MRPLHDGVVVELEPIRQQTGLIFTGHAESRVRVGSVVQVGPGSVSKKGQVVPTGLQVGDRVAFLALNLQTRNGAAVTETLMRDLGDNMRFIKARDVLAILDSTVQEIS